MPREATITHEQVTAVADAIKAEGGKPTLRAVRDRLGSGSLGTVQKLLGQWQQSQGRQAETSLALPPALQRAILEFLGQEMAAQRVALESSLAEAQQAVADLAAENERQVADIEAQALELEAERSAAASMRGKAEQLKADLERTKTEAREAIEAAKAEAIKEREAAEGLRVELAKACLRLEGLPRLEADLERLRGELDAERKARHEAERGAAAALASLDAAKTRVEGLEATLKDQKQRSAEVITKIEASKQRLEDDLRETRKEAKVCAAKLAKLEGVLEQIEASKPGKRNE